MGGYLLRHKGIGKWLVMKDEDTGRSPTYTPRHHIRLTVTPIKSFDTDKYKGSGKKRIIKKNKYITKKII